MKTLFATFCLALFLLATAGINAQDVPTSVGPAPIQTHKIAQTQTDEGQAIGDRDWLYLSSSPTFQFGKGFLETCTQTNIGVPFTVTFPGAIVNKGGTIWMNNQSSPFQLYTIDTVTGVHTLVVNASGVPQANFTGMTWDGTTMYGLSTTLALSQIFSINLSTGVCTPIGAATATCAGGISLSGMSTTSSLFAVDIVADNLYKFNKVTGACTLVGPLGSNANFGQDAQFDLKDGKLYWAGYTAGPELHIIDTTTGSGGAVLCTYSAQMTGICMAEPAPAFPTCGFTYAAQVSGTTALLQAVSTVSDQIGWVAGATAVVRKTIDGGVTWTNANPTPGVITGDIYSMYATDANNCVLTTSPAATFMYRTTNGGTTWTQVFTQAGGFIDAIVFINANTGFAYGDPVSSRWSLWKTINGGATWDSTGLYVPQNAAEAGWNNALKIIGNNIWFGTNGTRVYHSTNFGANWTFGATGDANSYSMHFNSLTNGLVGGGVMNSTTNGGSTYSTITAPGTGNITGLSGGAGVDYLYTRGTIIYQTVNSGTAWTTGFTSTQALWGIDLTQTGCPTGWAVGAAGTVIKIVGAPVGVEYNNNTVPRDYVLNQNYPNPFNPSTQISFGLPKAGNVKLVIFDILGREVKTLVNEFQTAGTHSITFDASSLASGIYFYSITANDFTASKKMLLVK